MSAATAGAAEDRAVFAATPTATGAAVHMLDLQGRLDKLYEVEQPLQALYYHAARHQLVSVSRAGESAVLGAYLHQRLWDAAPHALLAQADTHNISGHLRFLEFLSLQHAMAQASCLHSL